MKKVLLIHNIPNPYRIPLFNLLSNKLAELGYHLKIVFGDIGYKRRKWKINLDELEADYEILKNKKISYRSSTKSLFLYNGVIRLIRSEKPDIIILTGFSIATLKVCIYSLFNHKPLIVWSGSIVTKGRKEKPYKRLYRKILLGRISQFVAYGTKAKEYLINLGAKEKNISIAINTTQVDFFRDETKHIRESELINNKGNFIILSIGYITRLKRLDLILKALYRLKDLRQDFEFHIVGDGEYRNELERLVAELKLNDMVKFFGFKQKQELPAFLANGDCFVFPSEYDIWGLVVIEAMASGIPVLSSIHSGVTHDLIIDYKSGFALDFENVENTVELFNRLIDDREFCKQVGKNSALRVFEFAQYENSVKGFINAIEKCNQ